MRCDALLAEGPRLGAETALVFSVTGLALAVPAALLPFVHAGKLGIERTSSLFTGVASLWDGGMRLLAMLIFLCGGLLPLALLVALAVLHYPSRAGREAPGLQRVFQAVRVLGRWAIPEVQVLAVLVALMKLGNVVDVKVGPGFLCYCAMTLSLLVAQRSFEFGPAAAEDATEGSAAGAQP